MYRLLPFVISELEGDKYVVQNCKNTVIVNNKLIGDFFLKSELDSKNDYTAREIQSVFGDEAKAILEFLLDNYMIKELSDIKFIHKGIKFISNDDVFIDSLNFNSKGVDYDIQTEKVDNSSIDNFSITPEYLHIVFLNPFSQSSLIKINDKLKNGNAVYRVAFYYQHRVFVSNYYNKSWYNPCPLCFFANVESSLRGQSKVSNSVSFQAMLDYIYSRNTAFELENKFTNYSILNLVNVLLEDSKIENNQQINRVFIIDYNKNIVASDEAIFWDMCDCYE